MKNTVFYDVGASGGAMLALATHFGVMDAGGCEAQPLEELTLVTMISNYTPLVHKFWIDAGTPIEKADLWPAHLDCPYPDPKVLVVYCFDVGFSEASRDATYNKVGEVKQACILITCKPQGSDSRYSHPGAVLTALNTARGKELPTSTDWKFALQFPITMRSKASGGGGEIKQAWVFYKDIDGHVDFGWVEGAAGGVVA